MSGGDETVPRSPGHSGAPLLSVRNLKKHYPITTGILKREIGRVKAVDGISFDIYPGETVGIVGESGCGKSTAATSLLRLEEPTEGDVIFAGEDVTEYDSNELKMFRRKAQMIFQDPESSFDPRMSVGDSIAEPLLVQGMSDKVRRRAIVEDLLERVGLSSQDADRYPHEFSGGQKQRIALARALSVNPDLIVADEPVSALDVSVQSEILRLMSDLQDEFGLSILVISHDMGVIQQICDRVAVMYLGEIVEQGPTGELFAEPQHPYSRALISAIPTPDPHDRGLGTKLTGDVPSPSNPPSGCRFHTRCPEIIQPDGFDMNQDDFRHLVDLWSRLQNDAIDLEAARKLVVGQKDEYNGVDDVPPDETKLAIQYEYDLHEGLGDSAAETILDEALNHVLAGEQREAAQYLESKLETPCVTDKPELERVEPDRVASCHILEKGTNSRRNPKEVELHD